ncbi:MULTISPECIES: helix-turn-helix transcriptional regulator [unclassified Streptomyces]|uniref:helix-turn-helix domain-containing protein n=1 Tax=unclassified Streptomyces TaxID=2593676 RepID=UPI0003716468|nr:MULTISPECIES: helix-turn-helix transcriptional regulator [unclassified Streptomyces]MYT28908.1 response regulator transcription factor family protein [Streptomyces sp. SID8354]
MVYADWGDPQRTLAVATELMRAPLKEILSRMSAALADLVPHEALVMLTGDCPKSANWGHGDAGLTAEVTTAELATLATHVGVGRPWWGRAALAGSARPVLAVASAPPGSAGALLAVMVSAGCAPEPEVLALVQQLWDLATARVIDLLPGEVPVDMAAPWIANSERARAVADATDAHAATLTALLGVLRSRTLPDAAARRTATDVAVAALVELRATDEDAQLPPEESLQDAFGRLTDMLSLLSRHGDVTLQYSEPDSPRRLIPSAIARAARTTARGTVLTMLEQGGVERIRVSWEAGDTELRTVIRDDGPGTLAAEALAVHRLTDRVVALGGTLTVDAVPAWGTIVTVRLPLAAPDVPRSDPLSGLHPRELDVLRHLVHGHRNRTIAEALHISEHTVKFHVGKILKKLEVRSRGEAAALARAAGFPAAVSLVH